MTAAAGFGLVAAAVDRSGGDIVAVDVISGGSGATIRDITVQLPGNHYEALIAAINDIQGVTVINVSDRTFLAHLGGKIEIKPKITIKNREDLSHVYTP